MEASALTRTMVESVVDRGIREIAQDPRRSLRKLVDMGGLFAEGRFQKRFFALLQAMLEDETSPYYEMVRATVAGVDPRHLKTFGMALGWESWTVGARRIRAFERERGYNIPWSLTFRMGAGAMGPTDYRRVLAEAKAKGICTYFFFLTGQRGELDTVLELAGGQSECAFLLFTPPALLEVPALRALARRDNAAVVVDADAPGWQAAVRRLREERRLYGLYRSYGDRAEGEALASDRGVEELLELAGPMLICVARPGCPLQTRERVRAWAEEARTGQRWGVVPVDFFAEVLMADRVISDGERFLAADPDGGVWSWSWEGGEQPLPLNFRAQGLTELLEEAERLVK